MFPPLLNHQTIKIAESGIENVSSCREDAHEPGYDAVLVGEALVKAQDPQSLLKELTACSLRFAESKNAETAATAAKEGADFIGMILTPGVSPNCHVGGSEKNCGVHEKMVQLL